MRVVERRARSAIACAALGLASLASVPAGAVEPVVAPNYQIGNALKGAAPASQASPAATQPPPAVDAPVPDAVPAGDAPGVAVRDFAIGGERLLSDAEVAAVLAPYRGQTLSMAQINRLAARLTAACRRKGYLLALVYVPRQALREGVLHFEVSPGRYGALVVENHSHIVDALVTAPFRNAAHASPEVTRATLERAMLLVSAMPGGSLPVVTLAPGATAGTTDLRIRVDGAQRVGGYLVADDYGSDFTGVERLGAGLDLNNLAGIGDELSLSGLSTRHAGLRDGHIGYALPLSDDGARAEVQLSRTTYVLGGAYSALVAQGLAHIGALTLSYPLVRERLRSLTVSMGWSDKVLRDEIEFSGTTIAKRSRSATFSLASDQFTTVRGRAAHLVGSLDLTAGHLHFEDPVQDAQNRLGANTVGGFTKIAGSIALDVQLNQAWTLASLARFQRAIGRGLDGSEQFSASGPAGLRAYPEGVLNDNGVLARTELRHALPAIAGASQWLGLKLEYGNARPKNNLGTPSSSVSIGDVGAAYALGGRHAFAEAELVRTTGSDPSTDAYNAAWRIRGQLGMRF